MVANHKKIYKLGAVIAVVALTYFIRPRRSLASTRVGSERVAQERNNANVVPFSAWKVRPGIQGYAWHASNPRAALLLQHGYGEYCERYVDDYRRLIPSLLAAGISVYGFDLAGHGRSAGDRVVTDVAQAVEDHLVARRRLEGKGLPLFALGHSLGGLITAVSVARDGNGLAGAVIMSAGLTFDVPIPLRRGLTALARVAPGLRVPIDAGPFDKLYRGIERTSFLASRPMFYTGRLSLLLATSIVGVAARAWSLYPDWTVPTLIMHGAEDAYTDVAGSKCLFASINAIDKTLSIVPGGYHELLNDDAGDRVLREVLDWIDARISNRVANAEVQ